MKVNVFVMILQEWIQVDIEKKETVLDVKKKIISNKIFQQISDFKKDQLVPKNMKLSLFGGFGDDVGFRNDSLISSLDDIYEGCDLQIREPEEEKEERSNQSGIPEMLDWKFDVGDNVGPSDSNNGTLTTTSSAQDQLFHDYEKSSYNPTNFFQNCSFNDGFQNTNDEEKQQPPKDNTTHKEKEELTTTNLQGGDESAFSIPIDETDPHFTPKQEQVDNKKLLTVEFWGKNENSTTAENQRIIGEEDLCTKPFTVIKPPHQETVSVRLKIEEEKTEDSTFKFNHFLVNRVTVGEVGPGENLLAINNISRIIAIGCSDGVYVLPTFELHRMHAVGKGMEHNLRSCRPRNILIKEPLQLEFNSYGDILGVRNNEGIFFFSLTRGGEKIDERSMVGNNYKDFQISQKRSIGVLTNEGQFIIYRPRSQFDPHHYSNVDENNDFFPEKYNGNVNCFSFSPPGGRVMLGTKNGMIILYNWNKRQTNAIFAMPGTLMIHSLSWIQNKVCFASAYLPHFSSEVPTPRVLFFDFSRMKNTLRYQCQANIFPQIIEKNDLHRERRHIIRYLDHWNAILVTTNDCERLNIFEEYDDGWFALEDKDQGVRDDKGERSMAEPGQFFHSGNFCRGFVVDNTFRIPVGQYPVSPVLITLKSNGVLKFTQILSMDETDNVRKYQPLEVYSTPRTKEIYMNQWRNVYALQRNFADKEIFLSESRKVLLFKEEETKIKQYDSSFSKKKLVEHIGSHSSLYWRRYMSRIIDEKERMEFLWKKVEIFGTFINVKMSFGFDEFKEFCVSKIFLL